MDRISRAGPDRAFLPGCHRPQSAVHVVHRAEVVRRSLLGQRVAINASVRTLADAAIVLRRWKHVRSRRALLGLFGLSRAADALLLLKMSRETHAWWLPRVAVDGARAYAWGGIVGDDIVSARSNVISSALPHALEAGFRLRASTDAVPVIDERQPFPPSGPANWLGQLSSVAFPVVIPAAAAAVRIRRPNGQSEMNQAGWPLLGAFVGFALAHERERTQASIRDKWERGVDPWLKSSHEAGRVRSAVRSSPGHDFKKTLLALGALGSAECYEAARSQGHRPRDVLASASTGDSLWNVCQRIGVWPEPASAWPTWVTQQQEAELLSRVREVQRRLGPAVDAETELEVTHADAEQLRCCFRGEEIVVSHRWPEPSVRLDPVAWSLLVSGVWKGLTPVMAGLSPIVAGAAATIDMATFVHYVRGHPSEAEELLVLASQTLSTAIVDVASALGHSQEMGRSGEVAFASTMGTLGLLLTIGRYGPTPSRRFWSLMGIACGLWAVGAARTARRHPEQGYAELAYLLMAPLATLGLDERIEHEADTVEAKMREDFRLSLGRSYSDGTNAELGWFSGLVDLAERELERLEPTLGSDDLPLAEQVRHDCARVRRWLEMKDSDRWRDDF